MQDDFKGREIGVEKLVRKQVKLFQVEDNEGLNQDGGDGEEGIDGWERYCRGRKLIGFDNFKYEILYKSVYYFYSVLFRVVKICRLFVIDVKK